MNEIRKLRQSFQYAWRGIRQCMYSERNFRIHLVAAMYVTCFAWMGRLSRVQVGILVLCFGVMLGAELMNTAIERLCDWKASGYDRMVRDAKDIAAAGVFVCALACVGIGVLFFGRVYVIQNIVGRIQSHIWIFPVLVLSVPPALWFIFAFGRKR